MDSSSTLLLVDTSLYLTQSFGYRSIFAVDRIHTSLLLSLCITLTHMFSTRVVASLARASLRRTSVVAARRSALHASRAVVTTLPRAFSTATAAATAAPMTCRQCQQTENNVACTTTQGVCGKTAATSAAQDALMESVKSLSAWCQAARRQGIDETQLRESNVLTLQAVFATLTNVNFDEARITDFVQALEGAKARLKTLVATPPTEPVGALDWRKHDTPEAVTAIGKTVSIPTRAAGAVSADAFSLMEIATYGLKGVCAYATHCYQLGKMDAVVMAEIHRLFALISDSTLDVPDLLPAVLKVGEINAAVLAMLDAAHAEHFGAPEPTQYRTTAVQGKSILISGHDLIDLYHLLEQTAGTGVNVYTHGEMLPAHAYPKLKEFPHLVGNYGTAWQNQKVRSKNVRNSKSWAAIFVSPYISFFLLFRSLNLPPFPVPLSSLPIA